MTEFGTLLLPAAPLLGLLAILLLGRYPGCEAVVRLSERIAARCGTAGEAAEPRSPLPKPPRSFAPSGGLLMALGLAQRPPPRPA